MRYSLLFCVDLTVFDGGYPIKFSKDLREIGLGGKPRLTGNIRDGVISITQKLACCLQAAPVQVLDR